MAGKKSGKDETPGFEALLSEAESLANRMEEGGLTLEQSLAAYEQGVRNLRLCAGMLRGAEEKVKVLLEKNGAFRLEDLDPAEGNAGEAAGGNAGRNAGDVADGEDGE